MRIAIAGGHGQIGRHLIRLLVGEGHDVRSLDRNPGHAPDISALGAEPVTCDLEKASAPEVTRAIGAADAVVFAAGAGPGSGPERKWTMDHGGAVKLIEGAKGAGTSRYLMVSAMAADPEARGDDTFSVYLRAKGKADAELAASGLDFTIVRPGMLTDDEPTGLVTIGDSVGRGSIPRADVAALLAACLETPGTIGATFEAIGGETPIADALSSPAG